MKKFELFKKILSKLTNQQVILCILPQIGNKADNLC